MNYGESVTLAPGYYRAVFAGDTTLRYSNGGWSEIAIYVWTSSGFSVTDFNKLVSSSGVSEHTFGYFRIDQPGQLLVFARASTTCGNAYLSGALGFERVGD